MYKQIIFIEYFIKKLMNHINTLTCILYFLLFLRVLYVYNVLVILFYNLGMHFWKYTVILLYYILLELYYDFVNYL